MNEKKEFYVTIKGEKVMVSEEVYRAYIRPLRAERLRKLRAWKCQVKGKKGNLVRCQEDCSKCPYALAGKNATGNTLLKFILTEYFFDKAQDKKYITDKKQEIEDNKTLFELSNQLKIYEFAHNDKYFYG